MRVRLEVEGQGRGRGAGRGRGRGRVMGRGRRWRWGIWAGVYLFIYSFAVPPFSLSLALPEKKNADDKPRHRDAIKRSHMVLIVTIAAQRYMVDVGFGRNGPTLPLLLENNAQEDGIAPGARVRLVRDSLPQSLHRADNAQKLWIYQHRGPSNRTHHHHASVAGMVGQEAEGRMEERENWIPNYAFTELEFFPQDFENMKFVVGRARTSFFTYTVVVMKYLVERDEEGEAVCTGTVQMLGGQVKRTVGGKSEVLKDCRTEGERVKVLEDVFGIRLSERERKGIVGTVAELRGVAS